MVFLVWGGRVLGAQADSPARPLAVVRLGAVRLALCSIGAAILGAAQAVGYATEPVDPGRVDGWAFERWAAR